MSGADLVGQEVETFFADGTQHGAGKVVAYTDAPTFVIEKPDGTRESWRADMTKPTTPTVELPTAPTLGWIISRFSEVDLDFWRYRGPDDRAGEGAWAGIDPDGKPRGYSIKQIVAFTPATAVPTEALDELRDAKHYGRLMLLLTAVQDFLAAVDEADR